MASCFSELGLANPAFVLGLTNWALAGNVRMSPWLHLQTDSQNYRPIAENTELVVESTIADLFQKKGHEFIDVDMNIFDRADEAPMARVRLRAIYKLRPPPPTSLPLPPSRESTRTVSRAGASPWFATVISNLAGRPR